MNFPKNAIEELLNYLGIGILRNETQKLYWPHLNSLPPVLYVEVPDSFVEVFGALLSKVMFVASPASQKAPGTESDWQMWRIGIPKSTESLPSK